MEEIETLEKGNKLCNCTKGYKINCAFKKGVQQKCTKIANVNLFAQIHDFIKYNFHGHKTV